MSAGSSSTRRLVLISMLSACGLILFVFESMLPIMPVFPLFRLGLGNIASILALILYGFSDALKVTLLRVILGALILGRLFTPLFAFALTGGIVSAVVMFAVLSYWKRTFGPIGISVFGALTHNMTQLAVAYLFFVKNTEIFIFIPLFIATGVVTGNLTGLIASMVLERGKSLFHPDSEIEWRGL